MWYAKPCPWCGKPITLPGIQRISAPLKWYQVSRSIKTCPHCGSPVEISKKIQAGVALLMACSLIMASLLISVAGIPENIASMIFWPALIIGIVIIIRDMSWEKSGKSVDSIHAPVLGGNSRSNRACPYCGKPIAQAGVYPAASGPTKWYQFSRLVRVCPHCRLPVKSSVKSSWWIFFIPYGLFYGLLLVPENTLNMILPAQPFRAKIFIWLSLLTILTTIISVLVFIKTFKYEKADEP